jgi:hypothetical protein
MRQKIADIINIIFGFRKFLLMLAIYLIAIAFRIENLINGTEMVELLKSTTIAFMSANGVEHVVGAVKDYMSSKTDNPATPYEDIAVATEEEKESAKNG